MARRKRTSTFRMLLILSLKFISKDGQSTIFFISVWNLFSEEIYDTVTLGATLP